MRNVEIWKCLKMRKMEGEGWKTKCDKGFTSALHFRLVFEGYLRSFRTFESWNFTSEVESVQKACLRASGRVFRMQTSNAATIWTGVLVGRNSLHLAAGKILAITLPISGCLRRGRTFGRTLGRTSKKRNASNGRTFGRTFLQRKTPRKPTKTT